MRRSLSKIATVSTILTVVAVCLPVIVLAEAESDTTVVDEKARPDGSVRIQIDEGGIRVEGSVSEEGDTSSERRIIFDSRTGTTHPRRYHEKGTDIVKFGEDVVVKSDELVRGDIVVFGGDVSIEGKVVGNVVVMAGDAEVLSGAEINGDVVVLGGVLEEMPEVLIHGERVMFKDLSIPIQGFSQFFGSHARFFGFFFVPLQFFVSVILSFLIVLFLKDRVVTMQDQVQSGFLKSFGAGFLVVFVGMFVVCFLTIILLITLIGIPLAFVLVISCVALFIVARTVFVYALGIKVNDALKIQTANPFAVVLVGTAALYLPALLGYGISVLPFGTPVGALFKLIGVAISVFAYLVGLGALFISRFGSRPLVAEPVAASPAPQSE
jgi:hypothetical protein